MDWSGFLRNSQQRDCPGLAPDSLLISTLQRHAPNQIHVQRYDFFSKPLSWYCKVFGFLVFLLFELKTDNQHIMNRNSSFSEISRPLIGIIIAIALLANIVVDILLWLNAYVDGKYIIEAYGNEVSDIYYMRIGSLSMAMFINLGIAIIAAVLLFTKKDK